MDEPQTPEQAAEPTPENTSETKVDDQLELADDGFDPELDRHPEPSPEPPSAPKGEAPARDRNPDGTFKKVAPAHSAHTLRMAADLGIPQADVDSLSPESLGAMVYHMNKQRFDYVQRTPAAPPPAAPAQDLVAQFGIDTPEDYDPKLLGAIRKMAERLAFLEGQARTHTERETAQQIDGGFSDADPEFFGKGDIGQIDRNSPYYQRRMAVCNVLRERWNEPGSLRERTAKIAQELFGLTAKQAQVEGDRIARDAESGLTPTQKRWNEAALARPTARNGKADKSPERRAARAVAEVMRDMGASNGPEEDLI